MDFNPCFLGSRNQVQPFAKALGRRLEDDRHPINPGQVIVCPNTIAACPLVNLFCKSLLQGLVEFRNDLGLGLRVIMETEAEGQG